MSADNKNCIKLLTVCLKTENKYIDAIQEISQFILKFMQIDYDLTKEEILSNNFRIPADIVDSYYNLNSEQYKEFDKFDEFINTLCIEANNANVLVTRETRQWVPTILRIFETLITLAKLNKCHGKFDSIIARISLPFFIVIHAIRANHTQLLLNTPQGTYDQGRKHFILNTICNNLFAFITHGLKDKLLHDNIVKKMLPIIGQDFDILYTSDPRCLHFYLAAFGVQNRKTIIDCIESIIVLLNNSPPKLKDAVLEFLDSEGMEYFFPTFTSHPAKRVALKTFELLQVFITLSNDLDVWSTEKVRSMVTKLFDKNSKEIRLTAASNYISILEKKELSTKEILLEIFEYFLTSKKISMLPTYIEIFWDIWPCIRKFDYLFIIFDEDFQDICYVCVSKFIVDVCKRLVEEIDIYKSEVIHLLEILGHRLVDILNFSVLSCEILIKSLKIIPDSLLRTVKPKIKESLISELYKIMDDERLTKVVLFYVTNLLATFKMSTLDLLDTIEKNQKDFINSHKTLSVSLIFETSHIETIKLRKQLIKLAAFSNNKSFSPAPELYDILRKEVIELRQYMKFAPQYYEIEGYAIELYANCLQITFLRFLREEYFESIDRKEYLDQVQSFLDMLIDCVNIEKSVTDIFHASKCLSALFNMYSILQPKNEYVPNSEIRTMTIELTAQVYSILIYAVVFYVFKEQKDQMKNIEYQRDILKRVIVLHRNHSLIPTLGVWKIVIYYGDTNYFKKELSELLRVLYNYEAPPNDPSGQRFNRILPSAIFNLKKSPNYPKNFQKNLKEFLKFITSEAKEESNIIKVSLVLNLLEMHLSILPVVQINNKVNRLDMLPMLNILLPPKFDPLIYRQIKSMIAKIRGNFLTTNEQLILHNFEYLLKE